MEEIKLKKGKKQVSHTLENQREMTTLSLEHEVRLHTYYHFISLIWDARKPRD